MRIAKSKILFLVLFAFLLFGGGSLILSAIRYFSSAPLRARFEKLLEEKYGEEFVCFDARETGAYAFNPPTGCTGFCAPKKDTDLVFEARTTVGKDSKLTYDRYPAAVTGCQLAEEFSKELDGVFGQRAVTCKIGTYKDNDEVIRRIKDGTLDWEFYYTEFPNVNGSTHRSTTSFRILIDSSELKGSYEDEWDALKKAEEKFGKIMRENGIEVEFVLYLYFAPHDMYDKCLELLTPRDVPSAEAVPSRLELYVNDYGENEFSGKYHRVIKINERMDESGTYYWTINKDTYIEARKNVD